METNVVCTVVDEHVPDLRWVVVLSNGETVHQDDNRPGLQPESAWIRLGNYVKANGLHIVAMRLQFRSHVVELPQDAAGYYFCKGALGFWGGQETCHHFIAGILEQGKIRAVWFQVPELEPARVVDKSPDDAGLCLIKRENGK